MAEERSKRRLAAILAADVVGYSRLMEADEAGTLAALKTRRKQVLEPLVAKHQGRVFKVTGDGVLVEFASAVNAAQCAVELQQAMAAANEGQAEDRQIVLRIGVNLGDVMVEGSDLYGDGVNIAARLERIAEPGGILVSGTAYDHVASKVKVSFEDMGTQTLKNIAQPVRAYRVGDMPATSVLGLKPVSDKPSIAVLPFTNMSGDLEQEYFADGIVEEIITALSRMRWLTVIARNSSFTYKDRSVDVKQIGRELGVRYVLEGSVRKATDKVRIVGQLIDTSTGMHLWADKFEGRLQDIFDLQDQVTASVVGAIAPKIESAEIERSKHKPTESLDAYDYYLRGMAALIQVTKESSQEALTWFNRAIEADPGFASAYGQAARCRSQRKDTAG
jgi:adenylate cyclase